MSLAIVCEAKVMSMTSCRSLFTKVGVFPLLTTWRLVELRYSLSTFPLALILELPQIVWCELASQPIINSIFSLLQKSIRSWTACDGGLSTSYGRYADVRMTVSGLFLKL